MWGAIDFSLWARGRLVFTESGRGLTDKKPSEAVAEFGRPIRG